MICGASRWRSLNHCAEGRDSPQSGPLLCCSVSVEPRFGFMRKSHGSTESRSAVFDKSLRSAAKCKTHNDSNLQISPLKNRPLWQKNGGFAPKKSHFFA